MKEIDDSVIETTVTVLNQAQEMTFDRDSPLGVIRQTKHQRTGGGEDFYRYVEFHPIKLAQFEKVDSETEGSVKEFQRYDHRSPLRFSITEHSVHYNSNLYVASTNRNYI